MANPWFRLYAEIANDPKVLVLTEALRWRYVALLCLRCNDQYENTPDDEIALALRITEEEWQETKQAFIKRRLLEPDGSIHSWENRQFISDIQDPTAAERQKRYRDKKRDERNATVTSRPPESDTDTEKDSCASQAKRDDSMQSFPTFWGAYPKKKIKGDAEKAWKSIKPDADLQAKILEAVEVAKRGDGWRKEGGKYIPYPASWLRAKGWEDETAAPVAQVFDVNAWMREKLS